MRNREEFTELLKANLPAIHRFIARMVRNHFDAEDIMQQTALKAFIHFTEFRGDATFRTWLTSIALNEVRGHHRRQASLRTSNPEFHELEQIACARPTDSPYHLYQESENRRTVEDALATLRAPERNVIQLRVFDGCGVADAARQLSISIAATKSRYHRAVRHLAIALKRRTQAPKPLARATGPYQKATPVLTAWGSTNR